MKGDKLVNCVEIYCIDYQFQGLRAAEFANKDEEIRILPQSIHGYRI